MMDNEMIESILDQQCGEDSCTHKEIRARIIRCRGELDRIVWSQPPRSADELFSVAKELMECGRLLDIYIRLHGEEDED